MNEYGFSIVSSSGISAHKERLLELFPDGVLYTTFSFRVDESKRFEVLQTLFTEFASGRGLMILTGETGCDVEILDS